MTLDTDYIKFVNQEIDEWRCQDSGLTHAACDVIQIAHWLVKVGGPMEEDHFSEDFATQYAARLWEMIKNLENTEKRQTEMRYPGGDPENGPAECHYVDTGTPVQEDKEKC